MYEHTMTDCNVQNILLAAAKRDYETLEKLIPENRHTEEMSNVEEIIRNMAISYRDKKLLKLYPFRYRLALTDNIKNPDAFEFILQVLYVEEPIFLVDIPSYVYNEASEEIIKLLIKYDHPPRMNDLKDEEHMIIYLNLVDRTPFLIKEILEYLVDCGKEPNDKMLQIVKESGYISSDSFKLPSDSEEERTEILCQWLDQIRK